MKKIGHHRLHNRLQNWRPSKEEVQKGYSNSGPKHEFSYEFHTANTTDTRLKSPSLFHEGYGHFWTVSSSQ